MGKKKGKKTERESSTDADNGEDRGDTKGMLSDMEEADAYDTAYETEFDGQKYGTATDTEDAENMVGYETERAGYTTENYHTEFDAENPDDDEDDGESDYGDRGPIGNENVTIPNYGGGGGATNYATVTPEKKATDCMQGPAPMITVIIVFNFLELVIACCILTLGALVLSGDTIDLSGYKYIEGIVTRHDAVFGTICIVLGFITAVAAFSGMILSKLIAKGDLYGRTRAGFIVYQLVLLLMTLLVLAVLGLSAYGLAKLNADPNYSETIWKNNVQLDPATNCRITINPEHKCGGYYGGECTGETSSESAAYCAGHFCALYCRVQDDTNSNAEEICKECIEQQRKTFGQFGTCFNREVEYVEQGCQFAYNEQLKTVYLSALIFSAVASFSQISLVVIISVKALRQSDYDY